jgi:hypothetical protein
MFTLITLGKIFLLFILIIITCFAVIIVDVQKDTKFFHSLACLFIFCFTIEVIILIISVGFWLFKYFSCGA